MEQPDLASSSSVHGTGTSHSPLPALPLVVAKGYKCLLCIPDDFHLHIPLPSVLIDELIDLISFPSALDIPIPASTADIFSSMPPIIDYSVIKTLPLPLLVY